jgi:VanZ family protein
MPTCRPSRKVVDRMHRRDLVHFVFPVAFMGVIFAMSSEPSFGESHYVSARVALGLLPAWLAPLAPWLDHYLSIIVHIGEYGLLALLWVNALARVPGLGAQAVLLAWLITVAYGVTDELHQSFVPGRSATLSDWLMDITGASLSLLLWSLWRRR